MWKMVTLLLLFLAIGVHIVEGRGPVHANGTIPEQVHIAATEDPTSITVTWITFASTTSSIVMFALSGKSLTNSVNGTMKSFEDDKTTRYVHTVILTKLTPGQAYDYQCGSKDGWSKVFTLHTLYEGPYWSPRFLVFGDLGYKNGLCLPNMMKETAAGHFDAILHVGDIAYDLYEVGDEYMRQVEPMVSTIPYMLCPGNHEEHANFTHYRNRYSMPGGHENIFYSWNVGPVHIISFSTEVYYFLQYGPELPKWQYEWIEEDLKVANSPENRAKHPWIITMGHRPMYCSDFDGDDCNRASCLVRVGVPIFHTYGLEDLFYNYGVDVELWGHEHNYERTWPMYNYTIYNGSYSQPYVNPKAPVHLITGAAGNHEGHDRVNPSANWMAYSSMDFTYSRMTVFNSTHLLWEQVDTSQDAKVIDTILIVKDKHGPEAWK